MFCSLIWIALFCPLQMNETQQFVCTCAYVTRSILAFFICFLNISHICFAGTGHAPFRGFVQERRFLLDQQKSASSSASSAQPLLAEAHLFFGCRRRDLDWIYRDEMEAAAKDGVVTSLELAFSREPVS